jgi:hypothetical protein
MAGTSMITAPSERGGVQALQFFDVGVSHKDVNERPEAALILIQVRFDVRVLLRQGRQSRPHGGPRNAYVTLPVGEIPQGGGNLYGYRHSVIFSSKN